MYFVDTGRGPKKRRGRTESSNGQVIITSREVTLMKHYNYLSNYLKLFSKTRPLEKARTPSPSTTGVTMVKAPTSAAVSKYFAERKC